MTKLRFSGRGAVVEHASGIVLRSDAGTFLIEDNNAVALLRGVIPLLNGSESGSLESVAPVEEHPLLSGLLDLLERHGLIQDTTDSHPKFPLESFYRLWTSEPDSILRNLRQATVALVGLEPWGVIAATELAAAGIGELVLIDSGVVRCSDIGYWGWGEEHLGRLRGEALCERLGQSKPGCRVSFAELPTAAQSFEKAISQECDLIVSALAPEQVGLQSALASLAHQRGTCSLFAVADSMEFVIGPAVLPGRTACWNCLRLRLLAHSEMPWASQAVHEFLLRQEESTAYSPTLAPALQVFGHALAWEIIKLIARHPRSQLFGHVLIQSAISLTAALHPVLPVPGCRICGGHPQETSGSIDIDTLKTAQTPGDLERMLCGWIDARTGIVAMVRCRPAHPDEPSQLPICVDAFLADYTADDQAPVQFETCAGKGFTAAEAMIGAVGEAVERYSASRVCPNALSRALLSELPGDVLDPQSICCYSEDQYNSSSFPLARFERDRKHLWVKGRWLDTSKEVWAPALPTYYLFPDGMEDRYCQVTSSGLAAGSDTDDASLRATLELIERDAAMLTWLCRIPGRRLLIDDALDPRLKGALRSLSEFGARIELYVLDCDSSIPTVLCLGFGDGICWPGVTASSAAHLNLRAAVRGAILEHCHSGMSLARSLRQGRVSVPQSASDIRAGKFIDHAFFYVPRDRAAAFDFLSAGGDSVSLSAFPEIHDLSLRACRNRLKAAGIRIVLVDLTSADIRTGPFRVARALSPCLQPLHCGFGFEHKINPRLRSHLRGDINANPHPFC